MTGLLLALDTATATAVVALGEPDGRLRASERWIAGYRHGEELLGRVASLLAGSGVDSRQLGGIVVGTGPGAFTGLRVGIATAKGLAHGLGIPLVGISTGAALLRAAGADPTVPGDLALLLPAGPSDRTLLAPGGPPVHLPAGTEPTLAAGALLVAVDLDGRAPDDALARGRSASEGLAAALCALGAARLAGIDPTTAQETLASLVPDYVTLPRGIREAGGEVAWSHDRP